MTPVPASAPKLPTPLVTSAFGRPRALIKAKDDIVEQMADDLRVFAASRGSVVEDDMLLVGWTHAQIAAHGKAATEKAQRLAVAV